MSVDFEKLRPHVNAVADMLHESYAQWVEWDDIGGHLWLTVFDHPHDYSDWLFSDDRWSIDNDLITAGTAFCLAEKNSRNGHAGDDMIPYPPSVLREILPDVFESDDVDSQALAMGERLAHVMDVRQALPEITERQYEVLALTYGVGLADADIAELHQVTEGTVRKNRSRALRSLSKALTPEGGAIPRREAGKRSGGRTEAVRPNSVLINQSDHQYQGD